VGFKIEGVLREYEFAKEKFQDQVILALLRRDWEEKRNHECIGRQPEEFSPGCRRCYS